MTNTIKKMHLSFEQAKTCANSIKKFSGCDTKLSTAIQADLLLAQEIISNSEYAKMISSLYA